MTGVKSGVVMIDEPPYTTTELEKAKVSSIALYVRWCAPKGCLWQAHIFELHKKVQF